VTVAARLRSFGISRIFDEDRSFLFSDADFIGTFLALSADLVGRRVLLDFADWPRNPPELLTRIDSGALTRADHGFGDFLTNQSV
jgi:hypothetical protein